MKLRRAVPNREDPSFDRPTLVYRMRRLLVRSTYPRVEFSLMIALAGVIAFLISYGLLTAGLNSMPIRYGAAASVGYLALLGFTAVWISWRRRYWSPARARDRTSSDGDVDIDPGHLLDLFDLRTPDAASNLFGGGQSGGGGASGSWSDLEFGRGASRGGSGSFADEIGERILLIVVIAACLIGGTIAIGYVIYLAPALLAEVFVDAVIVAALSRRIAEHDRRSWTTTFVNRTWLPAIMLVGLVVVGGWALQRLAPDARSIGPAIEAIRKG